MVTFGGQAASVISSNATQIVVDTPSNVARGQVNVVVTNPDGQNDTRNNGYSFTESLWPS